MPIHLRLELFHLSHRRHLLVRQRKENELHEERQQDDRDTPVAHAAVDRTRASWSRPSASDVKKPVLIARRKLWPASESSSGVFGPRYASVRKVLCFARREVCSGSGALR